VGREKEAVFLGFGFVSAQSQATAGMLLRQSLAKTQKSSLRPATLFLKTLYCLAILQIAEGASGLVIEDAASLRKVGCLTPRGNRGAEALLPR